MTIMYGIANCVTIQKARTWLDSHKVQYEFHDYKKLGIDQQYLQTWCAHFSWEKVLNRRGMMWRKTPDTEKIKVVDESSAITFMSQVPSSIKRPIVEHNDTLLLGFDPLEYKKVFTA